MDVRRLGTSDLDVTSIGLGCATFGREIDASTSFSVLDHAFDRGIRLLDTAAIYGDGASETVLGEWLKSRKSRERIVLATKVSKQLTEKAIRDSVESSLKRLGTDCIDLLQAHAWDAETPLEETLRTFDELVNAGKVRYVGCSNWQASQIQTALDIQLARDWAPLVSVQPMYNLVDRGIEDSLLPLCTERGIGVISYSPLAAGFLTGKYRRDSDVPAGTRFDVIPGHQKIYFTEQGFRVVEEVRHISATSGQSMAQLAIGWALQRRGITSVLIGARCREHVDQAFIANEWAHGDAARPWLEQLTSASRMDS